MAAENTSTLNQVFITEQVLEIQMNRPKKYNAMNMEMYKELLALFNLISASVGTGDGDEKYSNVRCVILSGAGPVFCSGIDVNSLAEAAANQGDDAARTSLRIRSNLTLLQDSLTSIEKCPVPVIAKVHGLCIGAGVDVISACDIRICSSDAKFAVKEVDVGLAADIGTLQRLPLIIGSQSVVRDWAYTARTFGADEALRAGLVSSVAANHDQLAGSVVTLAKTIASKSPIAVHGTKYTLRYNFEQQVQRGLEMMRLLNGAMLQTDDIVNAIAAQKKKMKKGGDGVVEFSKL